MYEIIGGLAVFFLAIFLGTRAFGWAAERINGAFNRHLLDRRFRRRSN